MEAHWKAFHIKKEMSQNAYDEYKSRSSSELQKRRRTLEHDLDLKKRSHAAAAAVVPPLRRICEDIKAELLRVRPNAFTPNIAFGDTRALRIAERGIVASDRLNAAIAIAKLLRDAEQAAEEELKRVIAYGTAAIEARLKEMAAEMDASARDAFMTGARAMARSQ